MTAHQEIQEASLSEKMAVAAKSGANSMVVPKYENTTGQLREDLDKIIPALTAGVKDKSITAIEISNLGQDAMKKTSEVSTQIIGYNLDTDGGEFRAAVNSALEHIKKIDLSDLPDTLARNANLVTKQSNVSIKKIKLFLSRFSSSEDTKTKSKVDLITAELQKGIAHAPILIRNLKKAIEDIPVKKAQIIALGKENIQAYGLTTTFLVGIREFKRILDEEMIPEAEQAFEGDGSIENLETLQHLKQVRIALNTKETVFELARNQSAESVQTLVELHEALANTEVAADTIIRQELPMWQRVMATGLMAADTYETTRVVTDFREAMDGMRSKEGELMEHVRVASEKVKIDNPERLQERIDATKRLAERLKQAINLEVQQRGVSSLAAKKRQELEKVTDELLQAEIKFQKVQNANLLGTDPKAAISGKEGGIASLGFGS